MPKPIFIFHKKIAENRNFRFLCRKLLPLLVCLLLLTGLNNTTAQSGNYEYSDTSILSEQDGGNHRQGSDEFETDTILYKRNITLLQDTIDSWHNDKKFAYMKNLDSLLKAYESREDPAAESSARRSSPSFVQGILTSGFMQLVFWAIAIIVVLYILYRLYVGKGNFIFKRNPAGENVKEMEEQEPVRDASDYDLLVQQSYKLSDYRMAVRYLFLKTLRILTDKQLIHYAVEKTNFQYVQEIAPDKRNDFANLVLNYEYVWYGNIPISKEQYAQIEKKIISFNNRT